MNRNMKMFLRFSRWFFPLVGFIFFIFNNWQIQMILLAAVLLSSIFACIETLAK